MPITSSAKKALRVSERKQSFNGRTRSRMRSAVKTVSESPSLTSLSEAYRRIDRAVKAKLLHRNTAARKKASLAKSVKTTAAAK